MGFLFRRERFGRVVLVAAVTYGTFTYGTTLWMFVFYVKCESFKNSYVVELHLFMAYKEHIQIVYISGVLHGVGCADAW